MKNEQTTAEVPFSAMKLFVVWVSTITGLTLAEWATVLALVSTMFAIVYTLLQTYILIRDKIWRAAK